MEIAMIILAVALVGVFIGVYVYKAVARRKGKGGCGSCSGCASCPYCSEKNKCKGKESEQK